MTGLAQASFRRQSGRWPSLLNSARDRLVDELREKYPVRFTGLGQFSLVDIRCLFLNGF